MSSWSSNLPASRASVDARAEYLKKVVGLTGGGLAIAGATSVVSATAIALAPGIFFSRWIPFIVIMGLFAISNYVARPMVYGAAKVPGFLIGMVAQGVAMGFLMLTAFVVSGAAFGNPLVLIGLAMGLTFFAVLGMGAYTYMQARNFSMIGAGLSALSLPMLILMVVTFAFPSLIGGIAGIALSGLFVVISIGAVLYQLNEVQHKFSTEMHWEGAYEVSLGILTLFWNILSLLIRLTSRR